MTCSIMCAAMCPPPSPPRAIDSSQLQCNRAVYMTPVEPMETQTDSDTDTSDSEGSEPQVVTLTFDETVESMHQSMTFKVRTQGKRVSLWDANEGLLKLGRNHSPELCHASESPSPPPVGNAPPSVANACDSVAEAGSDRTTPRSEQSAEQPAESVETVCTAPPPAVAVEGRPRSSIASASRSTAPPRPQSSQRLHVPTIPPDSWPDFPNFLRNTPVSI